ncbi:hypothetical protein [Klebsiella spallanzanii]|uniref:hypothetical protein n=1 Tax=Klebsiella spallanzanii TaxID=2587528 RepID=UPI001158B9F8|nr:hypothetical protein [Klebsiella spallanzanii]VUS64822.1 hypothetical protein SB6419_03896 [Klebsiella spallanzanii]
MDNSILYGYAVQLCCSDHVSGFIPAQPVIDMRENITEQRLSCLFKLVGIIYDDILMNHNNCREATLFAFDKALELTCSDISCGVIAVEPILYDRDEKIGETIKLYFSRVIENLKKNNVVISGNNSSMTEYKDELVSGSERVFVLPVHKVMKKRKIKKGKR